MKFLLFFILLVAVPKWSLSDVQLVSSGTELVRPADNLRLVCKVTGVSITSSSYVWNWIRQPPGKGLEWIARIYPHDGRKWYLSSLQSRTTIASDNSKNEYSLQLNSLSAADTAVYYCAREPGGGYFDYWGKGTSVTVTPESPKAPSLFPLISTEGNPKVVVGCLGTDFLPNTISFSWNGPNNQSLSVETTKTFPALLRSTGTYIAASQADVPADLWNNHEPFYCKADHPVGNKVIRIARPASQPTGPEPEMLIRAPPIVAFSSSYLNSTVTCEISNLCSENTKVYWHKEEKEVTSGITTSKPIANGRGGYTIWSKLVITKEDWLSGKKFKCEVKSKSYNHSEEISMNSFCKENLDCSSVHVTTIPPSFADMFQTNSANLTCRISNIPVGQDISNLNVTWTQASDHKQLHTVLGKLRDQGNDMFYIDAIATVCATDWNSGEEFVCKVTFEGLLVKPVIKILKKEIGGVQHSPSVNMFPPSLDQLALRETVTIICIMRSFFPNDIWVSWMVNGQPAKESEIYNSEPILESEESNRYLLYSMLTTSEQSWSSGVSFTCIVRHESLPYGVTQKTIDKNTGKPSIVNVSLVLSDTATSCY